MNNQLSNDLLIRLEACLRTAGRDTSKLQAENPLDPQFDNTAGGRQTRMIIGAIDPQLYNDLEAAAPGGTRQSMGYMAAIARGEKPEEFTGALASEYQSSNPQLVQEQAKKFEQDMKAKWNAQIEASQRKREGSRQYDQRIAREKAQQQAAEQRAAEGRASEQRIAAKQQQIRDAGRLAMGNVVIPN